MGVLRRGNVTMRKTTAEAQAPGGRWGGLPNFCTIGSHNFFTINVTDFGEARGTGAPDWRPTSGGKPWLSVLLPLEHVGTDVLDDVTSDTCVPKAP